AEKGRIRSRDPRSALSERLGSQSSVGFHPSPTAALRHAPAAERPVALPPVQGKEPQMASLFFTCPTTHQQAPTGIETHVQSLRAAWKATRNLRRSARNLSARDVYQWRAETTDIAGPSRGPPLDCPT